MAEQDLPEGTDTVIEGASDKGNQGNGASNAPTGGATTGSTGTTNAILDKVRSGSEKLSGQARSYLDRGLLLEAERLYQSAVTADSNCAVAHAGLARVRERTGAADAARVEAHRSLELKPSADAYLVLGRLDLEANKLTDAENEAASALKLEPANAAAAELAQKLRAKTGVVK